MNSIIASHDYIIDDFEDYSRMPVITNLSDYKVGDVIAFDDAHGYVYAVNGEFDPLTGTVSIGCYDKNGNQVGSSLGIWDQREIVKIENVRQYDPYYNEYPDTFPVEHGSIVPITTAPPVPGTTKPPVPGTTKPPVPGTTNPPEPIPSIPEYTIPYTTIVYTGAETPEYSPHTGLNAVYETGDTKQSATGLGALAGLAAGAAGLGLTGLIGDKKEKEDEEDEDEAKEEISEEKPQEEKTADSSNPMFF